MLTHKKGLTVAEDIKIELVCATRVAKDDFLSKCATGVSLRRLNDARLMINLAPENTCGLPEVYNSRISSDKDIVIFIHDDVWIDDYFFVDRIIEGLKNYDVIGVAGNRRRVSNQPGWPFVDANWTWDDKSNLSGAVAHGQQPFGPVSYFGPTPASCMLLDGVMLAANVAALEKNNVSFDPRFNFHFYDLDFCRTAHNAGLCLGTWPICITHQSDGGFNSKGWKEMYETYLEKWGE